MFQNFENQWWNKAASIISMSVGPNYYVIQAGAKKAKISIYPAFAISTKTGKEPYG